MKINDKEGRVKVIALLIGEGRYILTLRHRRQQTDRQKDRQTDRQTLSLFLDVLK